MFGKEFLLNFMNSHYIPRLILKQFAFNKKINIYNLNSKDFITIKLKHAFSKENLYDEDLEQAFAQKLEGPFGDILNHKLLKGEQISITRSENLLIRKFFMIHTLRAPIINQTWEQMIEKTKLEQHPSVQLHRLMMHFSEYKNLFEQAVPSNKTYLSDLKTAMSISSLEDIAASDSNASGSLRYAAKHAIITVIAIWDCSHTGLEFILPELPGINIMDNVSISYKLEVLLELKEQMKQKMMPEFLEKELDRLIYGSSLYGENFGIYPISPTRAIICFSPYFRAFFPIFDPTGSIIVCPALLKKEQFNRHFYDTMLMELFEPCHNYFNQHYKYTVKFLTAKETMYLNSVLLNMETSQFAFHDFNKIRDSFWYYDHKMTFGLEKRHDFCHLA